MAIFSSKHPTNWTPHVAVALIIVVALAVFSLSQGSKIDTLNDRVTELQKAQQEAAEASMTPPPEPEQKLTGSVADAIVLLPRPEEAREGRALNDHVYWVRTTGREEDQLWLVDVNDRNVDKVRAWQYAAEGGGTIRVEDVDSLVRITYVDAAEGSTLTSQYYLDKASGKLGYWLDRRMTSAPSLTIGYAGKTQTVELDPEKLCAPEATTAKKVTLTGIKVGSTAVPFEKPQQITCGGDKTLGYGFYPDFGDVLFTNVNGNPVVRVALPWGGAALLALPDMAPDKVVFAE